MMPLNKAVLIAAGLALSASTLQGQRPVPRRPLGPPPNMFGGSITLINPVGEFGDFVDFGGGLSLYGVRALNRDATVGLRIDGSFVIYGHERFSEPFNDRVGRVRFDVNTTNYIASLGIGPQVMLGQGPVRPYLYGTVGFSYFATESSLGGTYDSYDVASTTNFDDFSYALGGGFGMLFRLSNGHKPVSLDMSVSYVDNGRTSYLLEGGVEDLPGGGVRVFPVVSDTQLLQYRVGVIVAFR